MKKIKAVIFDWAGTLVDFGCMAPSSVFKEVFAERGIEISEMEVRLSMGLPKKEHLKAILQLDRVKAAWITQYNMEADQQSIDEMYEALEPKMHEIISNFAKPIPGVLEVLDKLRAQGILIGSTTGYVGSMMEILYPEAQKFGLYVDSLVHSSDCKEGRPSPFMIFRNMENLGIYDVEEIIKVGDTVADMKEGLNAGTWTVGITKSGNEVGLSSEDWLRLDALQKEDALNKASDKLMEAGAHFVVDDLEEVIEIIQEINLILATEKD